MPLPVSTFADNYPILAGHFSSLTTHNRVGHLKDALLYYHLITLDKKKIEYPLYVECIYMMDEFFELYLYYPHINTLHCLHLFKILIFNCPRA